ncbi:asparagine synthase-related protein [Massilia solisilvae]|uniref:asparagine synthase (glutamine-hydrolyzing) n=1 Tax=Massilia solisilvae TaxID=1811225 RepID=A0ABT2BHQ5_9BURK|nr:asparagine synthase-related protein [Massilia solisilvae]MCS0608053.1 asparagine synthase-related protein [Massilia solisilvae]
MSGLCGWFSREPAALPIAQMAAPLCRFDQAPLRTAAHGMGAVALAGGLDCASLYHEDGLLIAHWGERVDALARLWRAHGVKACAALSGQFAFALIDERRGEALLAVDRAASRPLYYQLVGHTLVFASSTDAMVLHPGAGREVDPQALYNYLYFHAVPGSIYKGQRRLAPGEYVHLRAGRLERTRYWRLRFHERQPATNSPVLASELLDTIRGAVECCVGQQRTGVMLGGGPASTALGALLANASGQRVPTFAVGIGPAGRAAFEHARQAARALGFDHHERVIGTSEVADAIAQLGAAFDLPCGDPAALAAFYCALLARESGTQRLLTGQGAAELFGRRAYYARQLRLARYERLPSGLRQLLIEPLLFRLARRVRRGPLAMAREHIRQSMMPLPARLQRANLLHGYGPGEVFEPGFLELVDPTAPAATVEQSWWLAQGRHPLNRMIALDLQYRLGERGLPSVSRACDMAGVAVQFPYLNDALVAFAARLDPAAKETGASAHGLFCQALQATLPRRSLHVRGYGLAPPVGQWLLSDPRLRAIAFDSLSALRERHIVRACFIDQLLSQRLAQDPPRHGRMVWMLMMLEQWFAQRRALASTTPAPAHAPATART